MESRQQRKQQELVGHRKLRAILLAGMILCSFVFAHAQDRAQESVSIPASSQKICKFAVALPEMDGPVTLGIFSPQGNLVRLLYRDAPVDAIPAGLNGLLVSWNGKDDAGSEVPAGTYDALGLVHGKLALSSVPFSERDWRENPLKESNDSLRAADIGFILSPFPKNQITVRAARDALLENRPLLSITARPGSNREVLIEAEGLPLLSIPTDADIQTTEPTLKLRHGSSEGTAELTLVSRGEKRFYTISGLDQLVPLHAGALPFPP